MMQNYTGPQGGGLHFQEHVWYNQEIRANDFSRNLNGHLLFSLLRKG